MCFSVHCVEAMPLVVDVFEFLFEEIKLRIRFRGHDEPGRILVDSWVTREDV